MDNKISVDQAFATLEKFGGGTVSITDQEFRKLAAILLPTGKFVAVGKSLINISEIRNISPNEIPKKEALPVDQLDKLLIKKI